MPKVLAHVELGVHVFIKLELIWRECGVYVVDVVLCVWVCVWRRAALLLKLLKDHECDCFVQ